jgi:hypothetical protein
MVDFNELRGQAHRDIAIYSAVYNLAHGVEPLVHASVVRTLLPGSIGAMRNDVVIDEALKHHIAKRGSTVSVDGRRATSWCKLAANFRNDALGMLRGALSAARGITTASQIHAQLCGRDILRDLVEDDKSRKQSFLQLQLLMPYIQEHAAAMARVDHTSFNAEIDAEIIQAEMTAMAHPVPVLLNSNQTGAAIIEEMDTGAADQQSAVARALEALMGIEDGKILKIARSGDSADDRMRAIYRIDTRVLAWDSPRWGCVLGITDAAARKTKWWKVDRLVLLEKQRDDAE